jgi:hypothetical protein
LLRAFLVRLAGARRERELNNEIESHLQLPIHDNVHAGITPREARRRALIALGGIEQIKEEYRDRRGTSRVSAFFLWFRSA